jgi:uncharacterized membrane protein
MVTGSKTRGGTDGPIAAQPNNTIVITKIPTIFFIFFLLF